MPPILIYSEASTVPLSKHRGPRGNLRDATQPPVTLLNPVGPMRWGWLGLQPVLRPQSEALFPRRTGSGQGGCGPGSQLPLSLPRPQEVPSHAQIEAPNAPLPPHALSRGQLPAAPLACHTHLPAGFSPRQSYPTDRAVLANGSANVTEPNRHHHAQPALVSCHGQPREGVQPGGGGGECQSTARWWRRGGLRFRGSGKTQAPSYPVSLSGPCWVFHSRNAKPCGVSG